MIVSVCRTVFLLLLAQAVQANISLDTIRCGGDYEFKKTIEEQFAFNLDGFVDLDTRYGVLDIHTWDKEEVKVHIEIKCKSSSKSAAKSKLDHLVVDMDKSKSSFDLTTSLGEEGSNWMKSIFGCAEVELDIAYNLFIPYQSRLEIAHKHGDVYLESIDNNIELNIKHGNLHFSDVAGNLNLNIAHGNAKGGVVESLIASVRYGSLKLVEAQDVEISSKYSVMSIPIAGDMNINSGYDSYELGKVGRLDIDGKYDNFRIMTATSVMHDSKYSSMKIEDLVESIVSHASHGTVRVESTSPNFSLAEISGKYVDVKLDIDNAFKYYFETKYVSPRMQNTCNESIIEKDGAFVIREGKCGNTSAMARVEIDIRHGSIKID